MSKSLEVLLARCRRVAPVRRSLPLLLASAVLAGGCLASPPDAPGPVAATATDAPREPFAFMPLALISERGAGGEPVIAITPAGTILVAAHPGWTHTRQPASPNLVLGGEAQSLMWRSTDGGATWEHAGPLPAGPKGAWVGVSDPDLAVDADGRVFFTDLGGLVYTAVARSDDDGKTWLPGNPVMPGPVDRQWLAAYGTDVWFSANYFAEERVMKSTDGGVTWTRVGEASCRGDIVADPLDGTLYIGCGDGVDVSTDGGATWSEKSTPGAHAGDLALQEPAIDAAGNVYVAWSEHGTVRVAGSPDKGETWTTPIDAGAPLGLTGGTTVWPWVVAGDAGRVAVVWLGTPTGSDPERAEGEWFLYQATILDAMGEAPVVTAAQASEGPVHAGPICQGGTGCQLDPDPSGDRRLGDFFEAAVDAEGFVHTAVAVTTLVDDTISHPGYVRQTAGPRLRL